jgi:hypothetical protein
MSDPVRLEAGVQMLAEGCPGQSRRTWDLLRPVLDEGFHNIDHILDPVCKSDGFAEGSVAGG